MCYDKYCFFKILDFFTCHCSTTESHTPDTKRADVVNIVSPHFGWYDLKQTNYTNKQHVLKVRNITYVGGKTTQDVRVSTIL